MNKGGAVGNDEAEMTKVTLLLIQTNFRKLKLKAVVFSLLKRLAFNLRVE